MPGRQPIAVPVRPDQRRVSVQPGAHPLGADRDVGVLPVRLVVVAEREQKVARSAARRERRARTGRGGARQPARVTRGPDVQVLVAQRGPWRRRAGWACTSGRSAYQDCAQELAVLNVFGDVGHGAPAGPPRGDHQHRRVGQPQRRRHRPARRITTQVDQRGHQPVRAGAARAFCSATVAAEASPHGTGAISRMRGRSQRLRCAAVCPHSTASPQGQVRQVSTIATLPSENASRASARRSRTGARRSSRGPAVHGEEGDDRGRARTMCRAMRVAAAPARLGGSPASRTGRRPTGRC